MSAILILNHYNLSIIGSAKYIKGACPVSILRSEGRPKIRCDHGSLLSSITLHGRLASRHATYSQKICFKASMYLMAAV